MLPPITIVTLTIVHLVVVMAAFTWLPAVAMPIMLASLGLVFVRLTWLFGVWNPSLSGWRRFVVMAAGGIVSTGAIAFITVAVLYQYLPILGYRE